MLTSHATEIIQLRDNARQCAYSDGSLSWYCYGNGDYRHGITAEWGLSMDMCFLCAQTY